MSQENEYDIRDQRKILILEMSTNPGGEVVTQILLHSVIGTELNVNRRHSVSFNVQKLIILSY